MRKSFSNGNIGENISQFLYQRHRKQVWLAEKCGITPSHVSQIIKGKTSPSLLILTKIADALDVTTDDLIHGKHNGYKDGKVDISKTSF